MSDTETTSRADQPPTTPSITRSADGTPIAYETYGTGPVVVVVGGAFNDRSAGRERYRFYRDRGFPLYSHNLDDWEAA